MPRPRTDSDPEAPKVLEKALRVLEAFDDQSPARSGVARYVKTVDSPSRLRVTAEVGSEVPLTAGATAKAIFAFLPEDRIEHAIAQASRGIAAGTITDPAVLREQVRQIRERGWAFSW